MVFVALRNCLIFVRTLKCLIQTLYFCLFIRFVMHYLYQIKICIALSWKTRYIWAKTCFRTVWIILILRNVFWQLNNYVVKPIKKIFTIWNVTIIMVWNSLKRKFSFLPINIVSFIYLCYLMFLTFWFKHNAF